MPGAGGLLTSLTLGGIEVLRTMPKDSTDPLAAACFPLVPYANRVAQGSFAWQGTDIHLPRNFPPESSSLHGLGWQHSWRVASQSAFKCALEHDHQGGFWPWAYYAQQRIRLGPKGCAISLDVTNRSGSAMPAGLGLHPYFRRRPETRVRFRSGGVWLVDKALIPTGELAPASLFGDFAGLAALPDQTIDHCYARWDGVAQIEDDLGTITLTARGAPMLHVYAPADGSALCLEPVSHMPDALNSDPAGMTVLPPGCSASVQMWIAAEGPILV
jgi:aldose 1-epimerase